MNLSRNAAAIAVLSALALIGAIVLIATGHPVPDYLSLMAVSGLGALAGVALPDMPAGGASAELTSLVGTVASKLDALLTHVIGQPNAAVVPASTAVTALAADLAQGGPLPAPTPATSPASAIPSAVPAAPPATS
jgi:hypothetical protein